MYLEKTKSQGKYTCYLLRETYRQNGKVKHRTIANLSGCSAQEIEAIRLALKHKDELTQPLSLPQQDIDLRQGLSVGAVWLVYAMSKQLGMAQALGPTRQGKLALWQVIARVLDQGSRLSAVRLAGSHAACDILDLERFNEDDLYANLDWLAEHQGKIEDRLFKGLDPKQTPGLYLYDVTSSYLEGTQNELGAFGYNRDGKKGKRQIVIGLLCNDLGQPLSIEVFTGNTSDVKTLASQIRKATDRFGGGQVTFVGDRGMIKGPQIADLAAVPAGRQVAILSEPRRFVRRDPRSYPVFAAACLPAGRRCRTECVLGRASPGEGGGGSAPRDGVWTQAEGLEVGNDLGNRQSPGGFSGRSGLV